MIENIGKVLMAFALMLKVFGGGIIIAGIVALYFTLQAAVSASFLLPTIFWGITIALVVIMLIATIILSIKSIKEN